MNQFYIVLIILTLYGCVEENSLSLTEKSGLRSPSNETWELIEVKNGYGDWEVVQKEQKHFLTFYSDSTVTYTDAIQECNGKYFFDELENSLTNHRLTLNVPCMVPAPQLWWEHLIEYKNKDTVITYPRLNPTAYMSMDRYKYLIHTVQ